jgi:hypothetical protein
MLRFFLSGCCMGRRQGKGGYHGGGTIVRPGDFGFTPLDEDVAEPSAESGAVWLVERRGVAARTRHRSTI